MSYGHILLVFLKKIDFLLTRFYKLWSKNETIILFIHLFKINMTLKKVRIIIIVIWYYYFKKITFVLHVMCLELICMYTFLGVEHIYIYIYLTILI